MIEQSTFVKVPPKVKVIGVPVSSVTMETALNFIDCNFERVRGSYICASNVHTTVMARENPVYREVQSSAVMALPDGKPLSVVGGRRSQEPMEKVTGTHFMQNIFLDPRFAEKRHFFYGTKPETIEQVVAKVAEDYPRLKVCGWEPSVFRELSGQEVDDLAARMNEAGADFIWVALGAPRQEILMHRLQGKVNGVMTGVGGAFNILAGAVNDAPGWMQDAGLEWFYRLMKEPKRLFRRYLVTNTKFILYLLRDRNV